MNSRQGYRLDRPSTWEQSGKAGADVLFADPANKSTTIGVTVNPIKIASLEQFGDVETVRKRLIATEKQKVSRQLRTSLACCDLYAYLYAALYFAVDEDRPNCPVILRALHCYTTSTMHASHTEHGIHSCAWICRRALWTPLLYEKIVVVDTAEPSFMTLSMS